MRKHSEIVDEILGELQPLRDGLSKARARNEVITSLYIVRNLLGDLLDRSTVAKYRTSAKQIQKTVHRLRRQWASAPRIVKTALNDSSASMSLEKILEDFERGLTLFAQIRPGNVLSYIATNLAQNGAGDPLKRMCALWAYAIMVRLSQKRPASSSARSSLRVITSLVYERCKGRQQDLERACEAALKLRPTLFDLCSREDFGRVYSRLREAKLARIRAQTSVH
jgi:hypothetical protein